MVEVDGIDLRQVDPAEFRAPHRLCLGRTPRLFHGTLRDNVLMGRSQIDAARLVEVARLTGLDRVIAAHPMGWDLPVGEMGNLLSEWAATVGGTGASAGDQAADSADG